MNKLDEKLFEISQPTPKEKQLQSVVLTEADLRDMSLQNPEIEWPSVRSGETSGVLSMYVSIDRMGQVQETFPLNSDNAGLEGAARPKER